MKSRTIPVIAFLLILAAVLSSCKSEDDIAPTETTENVTTRVYETDYTYNDSYNYQTSSTAVIRTNIAPPSRTKRQTETVKASETEIQNTESTRTPVNSDKVEEINNGITVITKTSPVSRGNGASIIIYGTPGKTYSIEFYESGDNAVKSEELSDKTADDNGFASWTFKIAENCESGNKKIIVREKNSNKFVQTSITVQ